MRRTRACTHASDVTSASRRCARSSSCAIVSSWCTRREPNATFESRSAATSAPSCGAEGVTDAIEQRVTTSVVERQPEQLVEALVGDLREIGAVIVGLTQQRASVERAGGQPRRTRRIELRDLCLVPVRDAETIAKLVARLRVHPIQQLTHAQRVEPRRVAVTRRPRDQDRLGCVERASLLRVQAAEIIEVLTPGQELCKSCTAIVSECQCLEDLQVHRANLSGNVRAMSRVLVVIALLANLAHARPARRADNMPRGFAWPPSRTMLAAAAACEAKLDELGVAWHAAKREGRMVDAIALADGTLGGIEYVPAWGAKALPAMDCQLAVALAEIAPALYEAGVRQVHVGSVYRWSNVRVGGQDEGCPVASRAWHRDGCRVVRRRGRPRGDRRARLQGR